jgi:hypothetical protein
MQERPLVDVVADIETLSKKIASTQGEAVTAAQGDPESLSLTILRIARYNSALGKHAAHAKYIARNADRAARRFRAEQTLNLSKTQAVNKSELQAELDSADQFRTASDAQLIADEADDLTYRTDTFLKMAQSRLSLIKGDVKRG